MSLFKDEGLSIGAACCHDLGRFENRFEESCYDIRLLHYSYSGKFAVDLYTKDKALSPLFLWLNMYTFEPYDKSRLIGPCKMID